MSAIETAFVNAILSRDNSLDMDRDKLQDARCGTTHASTACAQQDATTKTMSESRTSTSRSVVQDKSAYVFPSTVLNIEYVGLFYSWQTGRSNPSKIHMLRISVGCFGGSKAKIYLYVPLYLLKDIRFPGASNTLNENKIKAEDVGMY